MPVPDKTSVCFSSCRVLVGEREREAWSFKGWPEGTIFFWMLVDPETCCVQAQLKVPAPWLWLWSQKPVSLLRIKIWWLTISFVKLANAHLVIGPTPLVHSRMWPPPTPHSHRWGGVGCHIGSIHVDGVGNCCMWACVLVLCGYIGSHLGMWEHTRLVSRTIITCDDGYPVARHDIQGNSCVTLATWGRVHTSDSNTTVMWTLVFEWYVVKCRSKNGHQKDMCVEKIGPHAGNMLNHSRLDGQCDWRNYTTTWWARESSFW